MEPVGAGEFDGHPYLRVGDGTGRPLVVVMGLNDPLARVTDSLAYATLVGAFGLRLRRRGYPGPVYLTSRPVGLPRDHTTREMAADLVEALAPLGRVNLLGLSMGGFVCQHLAVDAPDRVERLVLGLAAARLSEAGRRRVRCWQEHAERGEWARIYRAGAEAVATGWTRHGLRLAATLFAGWVGTPPAAVDFDVSARACLAHDATDRLADIAAPTLVLGGTEDPFFDESDYRTTVAGLPDARRVRFDGVGHEAVLERARAFDRAVVGHLRA